MKKGELLAEGRTAEVYAWGDGQVLKLYRPWWPAKNIEYEARIGRQIYGAGVAAPAVGEIVEIDGRHGLIYERLDGPDMAAALFAEPQRTEEIASVFAELHVQMHEVRPEGFPQQRSRLIYKIETETADKLNEAGRQYALAILAHLPDGDSLCHGDLHPGNVIMTTSGPRVIDWENACVGSPLADVARTVLLLEQFPLYLSEEQRKRGFADSVARFTQAYLAGYVAFAGADRALIEQWRVPVAAARLSEGIEIEEESLRAICVPR